MLGSVTESDLDVDRSNMFGVLWAVLGVGLFGLIYVSGKMTGGAISAGQIIWFRYFGALLTMLIWLMLRRNDLRLIASKQVGLHAVRALAGGGGGMAAIYAASNMEVASATSIGLLDGLFTILLGVFLLKEAFTPTQWLSALVCLFGAMFVVAGGDSVSLDVNNWFPALIALCGAAMVAIESIMIKTLARSEPAVSVLLYVSAFGTLIFLVPALWLWQPLGSLQTLALLSLGPIAIAGQLCNIKAFRLSDAALIGPIRYSWIIWGTAFGWIFFNEVPSLTTYLGSALILAGGAKLAFSRARR